MLLYKTKFGSQVYGTALPTSDIDVGKVLLESKEQIFGIEKEKIIAQKIDGGFDTREVYLKRFIKLCVDGNPNVVEWLFTPKEHIEFVDPIFQTLVLDNPLIYLQKGKLIDAHLGFAKSQIMKMRKHEKEMGAKREELYRKFGYDVKYASHALRLIHQLGELLLTGKINYPYHPKITSLLKSIKLGELRLDEFDHEYSEQLLFLEKEVLDDVVLSSKHIFNKVDYRQIARELELFYLSQFDMTYNCHG